MKAYIGYQFSDLIYVKIKECDFEKFAVFNNEKIKFFKSNYVHKGDFIIVNKSDIDYDVNNIIDILSNKFEDLFLFS